MSEQCLVFGTCNFKLKTMHAAFSLNIYLHEYFHLPFTKYKKMYRSITYCVVKKLSFLETYRCQTHLSNNRLQGLYFQRSIQIFYCVQRTPVCRRMLINARTPAETSQKIFGTLEHKIWFHIFKLVCFLVFLDNKFNNYCNQSSKKCLQ